MSAMTDADKKDAKDNHARNQRKARVNRGFKAGIITQEHVDAAEKIDWYSPVGFPDNWQAMAKAGEDRKQKTQPATPLPSIMPPNAPAKTKQTKLTDLFSTRSN